jgi:hypothetical protein
MTCDRAFNRNHAEPAVGEDPEKRRTRKEMQHARNFQLATKVPATWVERKEGEKLVS